MIAVAGGILLAALVILLVWVALSMIGNGDVSSGFFLLMCLVLMSLWAIIY